MRRNCMRQDVNRRRRSWRGRYGARRGVLDRHVASGCRKSHGYPGLGGVGYGYIGAHAPRRRCRICSQAPGDRTHVRTGKGMRGRNGRNTVILRRLRLVILRRIRASRRGCCLSRCGFGCGCCIRGDRRGCAGVSRGVGCCGCGRNRVGGVRPRRGREGPVRRERRRDERGAPGETQTADARFSIAD